MSHPRCLSPACQWCLLAHCPSSALDWDAGASKESCEADVNTLAGFVERKRPLPRYAHSEAYYMRALSLVSGGRSCVARSYLTELYAQVGNATAAAASARTLCTVCGNISAAAMQARGALVEHSVGWPEECTKGDLQQERQQLPPPLPPPPPAQPPPPPLPPLSPGMEVKTKVKFALTVEGSVETFNKTAFKAKLVSFLNVDEEKLSLVVEAASIKVSATVETTDASVATAVTSSVETLRADPSAASAALGVEVLAVSEVEMERVVSSGDAVSVAEQSSASALSDADLAGDTSAHGWVIGLIIAGVIVLVGGTGIHMHRWAHAGRQSPDASRAGTDAGGTKTHEVEVKVHDDVAVGGF